MTPDVLHSKSFVNRSSREFSDVEESVLRKGLNFVVTPGRVNVLDFASCVESALTNVDCSSRSWTA